ncbi:DNA/RNA non-specific endonuclease [Flavobacterium sp. SM15]|uniref:DNA/RNA non-specific endonuclease n=1 Tax=Flavobacterium sp. SM15 TaxID=2908005 RepID=UPI001EDB5FF5|nr:DNA/RNA non-specific endonuclease [Flavobacterium sp. SM15]MCG2609963.1 DNA/RNA non-specific endonuclease [Flavobacterium sp. SM15]
MKQKNKVKVVFAGVITSLFFCVSCRQNEKLEQEPFNSKTQPISTTEQNDATWVVGGNFDFYPTSTTGVVIKREGYTFSYSEEKEQSEWVAYTLSGEDFSNRDFQRPFFIEDPKVKTHSADWRNYKNSGYDKGHLCPAGDRKKSYQYYQETFFTSNISPQLHEFNDGVWNRLEQKVRYWSKKYDGLYVVTGGVLSENLKTIGKEHVAVPNYFYKVLMTQDGKRMIGFLVPHEASEKPLYDFVVDVDTIEKMTGIDFFPKLADGQENKMEKSNDYKSWSF